ncbi:hypothetical protein [Bradyrhizobium yuanmingense]|uniref:hypothetical protein n=1 Tax=Bradyrhizobium yuanmingense TaxID=108015 RepID=UPI0035121448
MPSKATGHRQTCNADLELRLLVVQCESPLTPVGAFASFEIPKFFMSVALRGAVPPVHVLIIVVGHYLLGSRNLPDTGVLAQEIANFWFDSDNRLFPDPERIGSLEVLVCDAKHDPVTIVTPTGAVQAAKPDPANVSASLLKWAQRLASEEGSVGVLHWIGHGYGQGAEATGMTTSLLCHGGDPVDPQQQAGINWTSWLGLINQITVGRQVYCFMDACRLDPGQKIAFPGAPGQFNWGLPDHVQVFSSTSHGMPAHWIDTALPATIAAGCVSGPVGTQAFLAALACFGAKGDSGSPLPVASDEVLQASRALVKRWSEHQGLIGQRPEGPKHCLEAPLLFTKTPMSLVDVKAPAAPPDVCEAQPETHHGTSAGIQVAETNAAPHQFRLAREPHRIRLDGRNWGPPKSLFNPYVPI